MRLLQSPQNWALCPPKLRCPHSCERTLLNKKFLLPSKAPPLLVPSADLFTLILLWPHCPPRRPSNRSGTLFLRAFALAVPLIWKILPEVCSSPLPDFHSVSPAQGYLPRQAHCKLHSLPPSAFPSRFDCWSFLLSIRLHGACVCFWSVVFLPDCKIPEGRAFISFLHCRILCLEHGLTHNKSGSDDWEGFPWLPLVWKRGLFHADTLSLSA